MLSNNVWIGMLK